MKSNITLQSERGERKNKVEQLNNLSTMAQYIYNVYEQDYEGETMKISNEFAYSSRQKAYDSIKRSCEERIEWVKGKYPNINETREFTAYYTEEERKNVDNSGAWVAVASFQCFYKLRSSYGNEIYDYQTKYIIVRTKVI